MAIIKTTPEACEFFSQSDPYNWVVDNRPLTNLLSNDLLMNAEIEAVKAEVVQARTGLVVNYATLDNRLDAMEGAIGGSVSADDIEDIQGHQYGDFLINSEVARRASPSGFMDHNGIADLIVGHESDDFAAIVTTSDLGEDYTNMVVMWTQWNNSALTRPVRALVNGWVTRLYDEVYGTPDEILGGHINIGLGSAPNSGTRKSFIFLEVWLKEVDKGTPVFYKHGAIGTNALEPTTDDHLHPDVVHSIRAMLPGGNWVQLQHRIRVISEIDPSLDPYGYGGAEIFAQGPEASQVSGYTYENMARIIDDPGLWRAGSGDSTSQEELGTVDGYVYSIPIAIINRRNSGSYTVANQNGSRITGGGSGTTGYISSGTSGRPDGLYYDALDQRDIQDLRNYVSLSGYDFKAIQDKTWQMLIRGELKTNWKQLRYDHNNDNDWEDTEIYSHVLTVIDQISNTAEENTNPLRDKSVGGAPLADPDGSRNFWGRTATVQNVVFAFTQGSAGSTEPSGFVTYNVANETLTFNAANLSGAGVGGTKIGIAPPIVLKKDNLNSKPSIVSNGLGTQTSTAKMSGLTPAAEYVGIIKVIYPGGGGISYPYSRLLTHEVVEGGVTSYKPAQFGVTGYTFTNDNGFASPVAVAVDSSGNYIVSDQGNHRVVKIDGTTLLITAQFGTTAIAGSTNTTLNTPTGVAVDTSNNVYICDSGNHRVIKLNSSLAYTSQFGVTTVSGADNTHTNYPSYIAVSGTDVYFTDRNNHRLVKLNTSLVYQDQFGATGSAGSGNGGLNMPTGVTVVSTGFGTGVWVADKENNRIAILNTSLAYLYQISDRFQSNTLMIPEITDVEKDTSGNYYVSVKNNNIVYKYNNTLSLVAQFGSVAGSSVTTLNGPSGIALDEANGWLYVCDSINHRVVKLLASNMTRVTQIGLTGKADGVANPINSLCPYPADVAVDSAGNVYVTNNNIHTATKWNSAGVFQARFGSFGVASTSNVDTGRLRNPLGIAVKPNASLLTICDTNNNRLVMLNPATMTFVRQFVPTYNLAVLSLEAIYIADVEWSASDSLWYVSVVERLRGNNNSNLIFSIHTYQDTPSGTPNYNSRFVSYDYPNGIKVNDTEVIAGTQSHGLIIHDKTTPTSYYYTADPQVNIYFKFSDLSGGLSSSDDKVLVAEPSLHAIHYFDATAGFYVGSAGVAYETGTDDGKLKNPRYAAFLGASRIVICDTDNRRMMIRHKSSPWISDGGTISTMVPPSGADKIRIFYESPAYQGVLGYYGGGEAIFKSQVVNQGDCVYASTLGLGGQLTYRTEQYFQLRGMTSRLPLPEGWDDYEIVPVGMKERSPIIDDGPYLSCPVLFSEGYMGGKINVFESSAGLSGGTLTRYQKTARQMVATTVANVETPLVRGFRTVLPIVNNLPASPTGGDRPTGGGTRPVLSGTEFLFQHDIQTSLLPKSPIRKRTFKTVRYGTPYVRAADLVEAVPHFNYYPFLYNRKGSLLMGVVAQATVGADVFIGNYLSNSLDAFFPIGRILVRGAA